MYICTMYIHVHVHVHVHVHTEFNIYCENLSIVISIVAVTALISNTQFLAHNGSIKMEPWDHTK